MGLDFNMEFAFLNDFDVSEFNNCVLLLHHFQVRNIPLTGTVKDYKIHNLDVSRFKTREHRKYVILGTTKLRE